MVFILKLKNNTFKIIIKFINFLLQTYRYNKLLNICMENNNKTHIKFKEKYIYIKKLSNFQFIIKSYKRSSKLTIKKFININNNNPYMVIIKIKYITFIIKCININKLFTNNSYIFYTLYYIMVFTIFILSNVYNL